MSLDHFTLALIDLQQGFWSPGISATFPDLPKRMHELRRKTRDLGIRTVHVRARFSVDGSDWMPPHRLRGHTPCLKGSASESVLDWGREADDEPVFHKQSFDAFRCHSFVQYLNETSTRFLLLAGLVTSTCVLFTAASAVQSGLLAAVVGDACADRPDIHEMVLKRYRFLFQVSDVDGLKGQIATWNSDLETLASLGACGIST